MGGGRWGGDVGVGLRSVSLSVLFSPPSPPLRPRVTPQRPDSPWDAKPRPLHLHTPRPRGLSEATPLSDHAPPGRIPTGRSLYDPPPPIELGETPGTATP